MKFEYGNFAMLLFFNKKKCLKTVIFDIFLEKMTKTNYN